MLEASNMVKITESPDHFLLQIEPLEDNSLAHLKKWLQESQKFIKEKKELYGGLYFKGFNINSAQDFETIAQEIDPNLCDKHPFNCSARTWHTKYTCEVANPDIQESLVPKGMHNEDSYVGHIPKTIMFYSFEPAIQGGETLVADCRKIYRELPDNLKKKLSGKIMINKLIMHDNVLLVNSRIPKDFEVIKELGKSHNSQETLRLSENLAQFSFEIPAVIKCDFSNDPIWFNLLHIAHYFSYNVYIDTWFAYKRRNGLLNKAKAILIIGLTFLSDLKYLVKNIMNRDPENPAFLSEIGNYYVSDGTKISFLDRVKINLAIWKSTALIPLEKGDMVALDNRLTSHGRMPFKGRRVVLASIGSLTSVENFTASV